MGTNIKECITLFYQSAVSEYILRWPSASTFDALSNNSISGVDHYVDIRVDSVNQLLSLIDPVI